MWLLVVTLLIGTVTGSPLQINGVVVAQCNAIYKTCVVCSNTEYNLTGLFSLSGANWTGYGFYLNPFGAVCSSFSFPGPITLQPGMNGTQVSHVICVNVTFSNVTIASMYNNYPVRVNTCGSSSAVVGLRAPRLTLMNMIVLGVTMGPVVLILEPCTVNFYGVTATTLIMSTTGGGVVFNGTSSKGQIICIPQGVITINTTVSLNFYNSSITIVSSTPHITYINPMPPAIVVPTFASIGNYVPLPACPAPTRRSRCSHAPYIFAIVALAVALFVSLCVIECVLKFKRAGKSEIHDNISKKIKES